MARPLTIERLKEKTGVTNTQLDSEIKEEHLLTLAGLFGDWERYVESPGLALEEHQKADVCKYVSIHGTKMGMHKALTFWLKRNPFYSFGDLIEILLQLGDGALADRVCKQLIIFVPRTEAPARSDAIESEQCPPNSTEEGQLSITTRERVSKHMDPSVRDSDYAEMSSVTEEVFSYISTGARDEFITTASSYSETENVYEHVNSERHLPIQATHDFEETSLASETVNKMQREFSTLYTRLRRALEKDDVSALDLISHLQDMQTLGPKIKPLLTSHRETLHAAIDTSTDMPTMKDVFHLMAPYCSWFNHLLVESIIEAYFDESHTIYKTLTSFKNKFHEYCHGRHIPLVGYGSDEVDGTSSAVFKIDHHWETIRMEHLVEIKETLASTLQIRRSNLLILTVNNGCLELSVAMPTYLANEIFPIQSDFIGPLKDIKTISFKYEQYSCNISETSQSLRESKARLAGMRVSGLGDSMDRQRESQAQQLTERLQQKSARIDGFEASPGAATGLIMADVGEKLLPKFFTLPQESIFSKYTGPLVQYGCYLVPACIPLGTKYRVMLSISGFLLSTGMQYLRWRNYRNNMAVRKSVFVEMSSNLGILVGTLASVRYGVGVPHGSVFVFLGSMLGLLSRLSFTM